MNSEKGFATIFALCMILVIALVVKGIQEAEMNHAYGSASFRTEFDLQNAADGGIYEAAEIVRADKEILPANTTGILNRSKQVELVSRTKNLSYGTIKLTVWGERINIQLYEREYEYKPYKKSPLTKNNKDIVKYGYTLLSIAEFTDKAGNKKYRRAFAYVVDGYGVKDSFYEDTQKVAAADKDVIHFLTLPVTDK